MTLHNVSVKQADAIYIFKNDKGFTLLYLDKNHNVKEEAVEKGSALEIQLEGEIANCSDEQPEYPLTDLEKLHAFIKECGGITSAPHLAFNQIAQITSRIFDAIQSESFVETLDIKAISIDLIHYTQGLEKLREVNQDLRMISPKDYRDLVYWRMNDATWEIYSTKLGHTEEGITPAMIDEVRRLRETVGPARSTPTSPAKAKAKESIPASAPVTPMKSLFGN